MNRRTFIAAAAALGPTTAALQAAAPVAALDPISKVLFAIPLTPFDVDELFRMLYKIRANRANELRVEAICYPTLEEAAAYLDGIEAMEKEWNSTPPLP